MGITGNVWVVGSLLTYFKGSGAIMKSPRISFKKSQHPTMGKLGTLPSLLVKYHAEIAMRLAVIQGGCGFFRAVRRPLTNNLPTHLAVYVI